MRRRPAALRPPASSSSHQTGQPPPLPAHRVSVARTGEQASFRLKPTTSSLPTRQAGDADQSSRPDGYERNQACSLATTPKLPESLSDRYSFIWTPPVCQEIMCAGGQEGCGFISGLVAGRTRWPRWNPLTHSSFLGRAAGPNEYSGLVGPGLTCLPSHLITLRNLLTCPSFAKLVYPIA